MILLVALIIGGIPIFLVINGIAYPNKLYWRSERMIIYRWRNPMPKGSKCIKLIFKVLKIFFLIIVGVILLPITIIL